MGGKMHLYSKNSWDKISLSYYPKIYFNRHLKVIRCGSGVFSVCLAILLYGSIQHMHHTAHTKEQEHCRKYKTNWSMNSFLTNQNRLAEKTHTVKVEDIDFAAYRLLNFQPPKISFRYWQQSLFWVISNVPNKSSSDRISDHFWLNQLLIKRCHFQRNCRQHASWPTLNLILNALVLQNLLFIFFNITLDYHGRCV